MIDKEPKVGRILFKAGYLRGQEFLRAGKITVVTAATVKYRAEDGDLTFAHRRNITAVCDTEEEAAKLTEFSDFAWKAIKDLDDRLSRLGQEFFK